LGDLQRGIYKNWLLIAAGMALLIGIAVSGSRSAVASVPSLLSSFSSCSSIGGML